MVSILLVAPGAPTNFEVSQVTTSSLQLRWLAASDSIQDNYSYKFRDLSVDAAYGDDMEVTDTVATIDNLSAGHQYELQLFAVSGTVRSEASPLTTSTSKKPAGSGKV